LYADRHGDGEAGRGGKDAINVPAGASLSALKIGILCELSQGEEVEIIGEEQEYFKIKPPAKAYLYVNKKFVAPSPDAKPQVVAKADQSKVTDPAKPAEPDSPDFARADPPKPEGVKPENVKPEAIKDPTTPDSIGGANPPAGDPAKPDGV